MTNNPEYEAPEIRSLGSVDEVTAGFSTGTQLDADFNDGTPFTDLTFS